MVEDEKYCIDILTQISALTSALEAVALGLLDDHLRHCVVDAAKLGGPEAEAKITEAIAGDRPPVVPREPRVARRSRPAFGECSASVPRRASGVR